MKTLTTAQAMMLVARATFRPFNAADYTNFGGCETEDAMMCDDIDGWLIVVDGHRLAFYQEDPNSDCIMFSLEADPF